ncbi:Choline-sulfatase [Crateriforma conspicua]|uniref:Choline-sulfatase n=1 Tax=Crateriforma conspicua TaxID=2527996 RepID=A0A5C5YDM6_9PLAN|nr:Choline-sulfatase [Crateriforma conspicua]
MKLCLQQAMGFVLSSFACCLSLTICAADDRPNLLIVLTDDHSVPHVGCYGNADIRTPNLDRFAEQGLRLDRMYVTAPQCVPARATIMTGQSSVATRMTRFSAPLDRDIPTFPERLRQSGYYTGVAGRIYHLDGHNIIGSKETKQVFADNNLITFHDRLDHVNIADGGVGHIGQMVQFLDAVPHNQPWFLQLSFDDPHRPLSENAIAAPHDPNAISLPKHVPDTDLVRKDFAKYYDEIARFDTGFGRLIQILEDRNLTQHTLILFMGDNGAAILRGKGTLYEWGLHVPALLRWDGVIKPGSQSDALITSEDIAPTFLQLAGVAPNPEMNGISFAALLKGESFEGREYFCAARGSHGYNLPLHTADFDLSRCVRTRRYKLIYNPLWQLPFQPVDMFALPLWADLKIRHQTGRLPALYSRLYFSPQRPIFELYDLQDDPEELDNLVGLPQHAAIENELKSKLHEWMILQQDYVPLPIADFNPYLER